MTGPPASRHPTWTQTYGERAEHQNNTPLATYLLRLVHLKRTNLCVSADVTTTAELLRLAEEVGDYICVFKTHADIISDFGDRTIRGLNQIAKKKKFLLFEDRKFGDIGHTVQLQYSGGPLQIVRWAQIVNAHMFPGPAIITALSQAAQQAIAKHNTSVSTDISASPLVQATNGVEDVESDLDDGDDLDDDDDLDEPASVSASEEEDEGDNEDSPLKDLRSRKQSVVSVTTTIDTQTEAISPPPSLRPTLSRGASQDDSPDTISDDQRREELEALGPPPFYRSLLVFAQMSSSGNMFDENYTAACIKHARDHRDFVMGYIAQRSLNTGPEDNFITMTPGVQLSAGGDGLGQQYNTPQKVIGEMGNDIAIVGRGILSAPDRRKAAQEYSEQTWAAYENRVRSRRQRSQR